MSDHTKFHSSEKASSIQAVNFQFRSSSVGCGSLFSHFCLSSSIFQRVISDVEKSAIIGDFHSKGIV